MKIKSLILAFPVLCLACSSPTDSTDPASNAEASLILAKHVVGVNMLSSNAKYDDPGKIVGEEYIRSLFNLTEKTELEEVQEHTGSAFEWSGNKVLLSFGGAKPYESIYTAEYDFDKMYMSKPDKATIPVAEAAEESSETEATASEEVAPAGTEQTTPTASAETHESHPESTSAVAHHAEPAVSKGSFEAVAGVGDKAVWNPATGAMHVLYANHIVNVTVETKDKPEVRKEHAQSLVEVLIEKIAANEYSRNL